MNRLKKEDRSAVIALLKRGYGIRHIQRTLGVHNVTIMRIKRSMEPRKIGRPSLGADGKSRIIQVRITESEHQQITELARYHKSVSAWIRKTLRIAAREQLKAVNEKADHKAVISL